MKTLELQLHREWSPALQEEWNALLAESPSHCPFLRFEYLDIWWRRRGGGEWPPESQLALITARQEERLLGIAPLFWTPNHLGEPALLFLGSIEISDYLDFIARTGDLPAFLDALLPALQELRGELPFTVLDLYNLPEESPTLDALEAAAARHGWSFHKEFCQPCPTIPLPSDWETYLSGLDKKQRHEIRRKLRRAESLEPPARWYMVTERETLDAEIEALLSLMEQDDEKRAFLTPAMRETMREMIHCSFDLGCLRLAFLEVGGEKAAAYLAFDYLQQVWLYNSGFDRRFNDYSPGWVLLSYFIRWAIENRYREFDFMRGGEDYKYRFGARQRCVMRVRLQPPAA
ncbi:MAG: GNAT family N-acetyltransferase [Chloroflexota bacterium]